MAIARPLLTVDGQPLRRPRYSARQRRSVFVALALAGMSTLAVVWLVPFAVVVLTAIRGQGDLVERGVFSWPREFRFANFPDAWRIGDFSTYFRNSLMLMAVKVPLGLALSSLAAYPLAKLRFRFSMQFFVLFLIGIAIPLQVALLPLLLLMKDLGLINTVWALIPPYVVFAMPFQIFVMRGFFRTIPDDLLDAARIDGASEFQVFRRILLPLALPVLATLAVIDALDVWNELLTALVLITTDDQRTVPIGLLNFRGEYTQSQTQQSAAILIVIAPILLLYVLIQRYLIAGLTAGALKE